MVLLIAVLVSTTVSFAAVADVVLAAAHRSSRLRRAPVLLDTTGDVRYRIPHLADCSALPRRGNIVQTVTVGSVAVLEGLVGAGVGATDIATVPRGRVPDSTSSDCPDQKSVGGPAPLNDS